MAAAPAAGAVRDHDERVGCSAGSGRIAEGGDSDFQVHGVRDALQHAGEHGGHGLCLQVDVVGPALRGAGSGRVIDLDLAVAEAECQDADLMRPTLRIDGRRRFRRRACACSEHNCCGKGGDGEGAADGLCGHDRCPVSDPAVVSHASLRTERRTDRMLPPQSIGRRHGTRQTFG